MSDPALRSAHLKFLHWGAFSGGVAGLTTALGSHGRVETHDFGSLTKHPKLALARIRARARVGRGGTWYKSGVWSDAITSYALDSGWIRNDTPTVFCQTLSAMVLEDEYKYVVYTDRVGLEGRRAPSRFLAPADDDWLDREAIFLRRAQRILTMGPSSARVLVNEYGISPDRVVVTGAGPGSYMGEIVQSTRAPEKFLFVGTSWEVKGGPEVLRAFGGVAAKFGHLRLGLVGSAPDHPVGERIRVFGRVPREEMSDLLARADVFIAPAWVEAFGFSLLEALLRGVPAIGSTVGNQAWLIGDAGLVIPPGDVGALSEAMATLVQDYPKFKAAALARAAELRRTMTWDNVATSVLQAIDDT